MGLTSHLVITLHHWIKKPIRLERRPLAQFCCFIVDKVIQFETGGMNVVKICSLLHVLQMLFMIPSFCARNL